MRLAWIKRLLRGSDEHPPTLLEVAPPRTGERTLLGVENLLQSIALPEPFSLEIAGTADGAALMVRCMDGQSVRGQLAAHYPQARIREIPPEDDPLRLREDERAWETILRVDAPDYVPLRVFRDDDLLDPGSDPLIALIGALAGLNAGERVVSRLLLRSLGPGWSEGRLRRAHGSAVREPIDSSHIAQARALQHDGVILAVLAAGAFAALKAYLWVQAGELWRAGLLGLGLAAGLAAAGWVWRRWRKSRSRVYDPLLVKEKISRIAFDAEIRLIAVLPADEHVQRARELLAPVIAAYRHYDHPAGARFKASGIRPVVPNPADLRPAGPRLLGGRSVLGVREAASLWHPPGAADETPFIERAGARTLIPAARGVRSGALVGESAGDSRREVRFPDDLLRRHHLYIARTRMGKSTLMQHLVVHRLREKAAGRDNAAIVVVDPHADLVGAILGHVPETVVDAVRLVDLADERGAVGINLLDARVFPNRDRTADSVTRIARGLWEQWGPRMQSILEHTVKSLHEANTTLEAGEQRTLLDGLKMLSDSSFRNDVLARVADPYLLEWWARDFLGWRREYQADSIAPVQTRLSYYASSKRARAILGQPRSTVDIRRTILDGGVLLVSAAQGAVGRDVAALVGASLLNLVDAVIREQESLPPERRRGALVVVDEMQTMPGVDYEAMLSELGKYGASFVLATQSLAKLDDLSRTMQDTLLANTGCLAVFQASGSDARRLVWELGRERVGEEDIVSQPAHRCYVRATVGTERLPAFSMTVHRPDPGDPTIAARIRADAAAYLTPAEEIAGREAEIRRMAEERRRAIEESRASPSLQPPPKASKAERKRVRSKRARKPDPGQTVDGRQDAVGEDSA